MWNRANARSAQADHQALVGSLRGSPASFRNGAGPPPRRGGGGRPDSPPGSGPSAGAPARSGFGAAELEVVVRDLDEPLRRATGSGSRSACESNYLIASWWSNSNAGAPSSLAVSPALPEQIRIGFTTSFCNSRTSAPPASVTDEIHEEEDAAYAFRASSLVGSGSGVDRNGLSSASCPSPPSTVRGDHLLPVRDEHREDELGGQPARTAPYRSTRRRSLAGSPSGMRRCITTRRIR